MKFLLLTPQSNSTKSEIWCFKHLQMHAVQYNIIIDVWVHRGLLWLDSQHKNSILAFSNISQHADYASTWNRSFWKTKTRVYCRFNIMILDCLVTEGVMALMAIILTLPGILPMGNFRNHSLWRGGSYRNYVYNHFYIGHSILNMMLLIKQYACHLVMKPPHPARQIYQTMANMCFTYHERGKTWLRHIWPQGPFTNSKHK